MNLKNLGIWAKPAIQAQIERERQVIEIVTITDASTSDVIEFLDNSRYDYDTIRQGVLAGASLDDESIMKTIIEDIYGEMKKLADLSFKKTFTDYLPDVPYFIGYYLAYPFIWLAFWFKEGVIQAREEIWD